MIILSAGAPYEHRRHLHSVAYTFSGRSLGNFIGIAHCFMPLLPPPRPINPSACGWKGQMKLAAIHEVGLV